MCLRKDVHRTLTLRHDREKNHPWYCMQASIAYILLILKKITHTMFVETYKHICFQTSVATLTIQKIAGLVCRCALCTKTYTTPHSAHLVKETKQSHETSMTSYVEETVTTTSDDMVNDVSAEEIVVSTEQFCSVDNDFESPRTVMY